MDSSGSTQLRNDSSESDDEANLFCPALPPHLLNKQRTESSSQTTRRVVGPLLPENYVPENDKSLENSSVNSEGLIGPLPSADDNVDKRFSGPEMEQRLTKMIADVSGNNIKENVRESWMLELPSSKPNLLGLGVKARQFQKKEKSDLGDSSVWTDTPADKERKKYINNQPAEKDIEDAAGRQRDEQLSKLVKSYEEKKREIPLIDSHRKKKSKTEKSLPEQRRPFSREEDLNVNKFDEAQKTVILKKARQLNDRFSSGKRKFL